MRNLAEKIQAFDEQSDVISYINRLFSFEGIKVISFLNAHACNLSAKSPCFYNALDNSDLLLRDGIGAKILLSSFGLKAGINTNGTDLIPKIIESNPNATYAFIGTQEPYISTAYQNYKEAGFKIIFYADGFQDFECYLRKVELEKPDIIVLGMGMPRQEAFSLFLKDNYQGSLSVINGGAIFDFMAGRFSRAPKFFRMLNIEWFYRLLAEPVRLFKRYVIGIPVFFVRLMYAKCK